MLTKDAAAGLCDALEAAGLDPTMAEEKLPTDRYYVMVDLDHGQQPADVKKIVQQEGMASAKVVHVTEEGCDAMHIS